MKQNEKKQFRSVSILFFVVFWVFFVHLRRPLAVQSTYKRLVRASVSSFVSSSAFCFEQIGCVFLFVISFVATVFKFVLLVSSSSSSVCVSGVAFSFCWLIRFGNAPGKGQKNGARLSLRDRCVCVCVERAGNICWEKNGWANGNQTTNTNETWAITIEWIETEGAEKNEEGVCSSSKTSSRPTALPLSDGDGRWKHKNNGNGCGAGSSDVPQAQIEDGQLRQLHDALQSAGGDLGAAVQVDAAQVPQMVRHRLRSIWLDDKTTNKQWKTSSTAFRNSHSSSIGRMLKTESLWFHGDGRSDWIDSIRLEFLERIGNKTMNRDGSRWSKSFVPVAESTGHRIQVSVDSARLCPFFLSEISRQSPFELNLLEK